MKLWQSQPIYHVFKADTELHTYLKICNIAVDDSGEYAWPFYQLHYSNIIRNSFREFWKHLMHDTKTK